MKNLLTLGPFMTLILAPTAQAADRASQSSQGSTEQVEDSLRLARLLAAVRRPDESDKDSREDSATQEPCRRFRYSSS
jgi:hypothetical protein